jgi:dTDP-4-dehydrorhamnose reductase
MILVTGAAGMVGSHLLDVFSEGELFRTDLEEEPGIHRMDIRNHDEVMSVVGQVRPRLVIHLAAETDVDRCEREPDHAYRSNAMGTLTVASACQRYDAEMVYVSTTALFDGLKPEPYTEFDAPAPQTVYARSKWEGEKIVQSMLSRHYVVRAGWMFGGRAKDKKFVGKIAALCMRQDSGTNEIKAVNDKFGSPTYARDLLHTTKLLSESGLFGLYHVVNTGSCTRYEMAVEIAKILGGHVKVVPVTSDAFVLSAPRAQSEAARSYKIELLGLKHLREWREALQDYLGSWAIHTGTAAPNAFDVAPLARAIAAVASAAHDLIPPNGREAGSDAP